MNHIELLGRLTRDPEVKVTSTGKNVTSFTLAVNRPFKNSQGEYEADFINIQIWGKIAELVGNSCSKGHRLLVQGRLQIRQYVGKDGNKKHVTEVVADHVDFIEKKSDSSFGHSAPAPTAPSTGQEGKSSMESFGETVGFDEEIPF